MEYRRRKERITLAITAVAFVSAALILVWENRQRPGPHRLLVGPEFSPVLDQPFEFDFDLADWSKLRISAVVRGVGQEESRPVVEPDRIRYDLRRLDGPQVTSPRSRSAVAAAGKSLFVSPEGRQWIPMRATPEPAPVRMEFVLREASAPLPFERLQLEVRGWLTGDALVSRSFYRSLRQLGCTLTMLISLVYFVQALSQRKQSD